MVLRWVCPDTSAPCGNYARAQPPELLNKQLSIRRLHFSKPLRGAWHVLRWKNHPSKPSLGVSVFSWLFLRSVFHGPVFLSDTEQGDPGPRECRGEPKRSTGSAKSGRGRGPNVPGAAPPNTRSPQAHLRADDASQGELNQCVPPSEHLFFSGYLIQMTSDIDFPFMIIGHDFIFKCIYLSLKKNC